MDTTQKPTWADFVGQDDIKRRLEVRINAALASDRPLGHVLLTASPGHGKTTLAGLIGEKLGGVFRSLVAPVAKSQVVELVQQYQGEHLIIFIDEFHLMPKKDQEEYLTLMEEGFIEFAGERTYHDELTIIAGTTRREAIIPTIRDRFPLQPVFEEYTDETMVNVVEGFAKRMNVALPEGVSSILASASGGVPRLARGLVEAARDLALTTPEYTAADVLDLAGVDADGLNLEQLRYLRALVESPSHRLGLAPLAARLQLSQDTVRSQVEPLLFKRGYAGLLQSGRLITDEGIVRIKGS